MLTRTQKEELVSELAQTLESSQTVVLCDYKGLTVAQMREIRLALREKQAKMKVAKKTLTTLAIKKLGTNLDVSQLEGQIAILWGGEDEITTSRVAAEFAKKIDKFKIAGGMLDKQPLTAAEVINLSKLPTRQEMLARLVGTINAPVSGFVNVLAGNLRNFVGVINAIKEAKA